LIVSPSLFDRSPLNHPADILDHVLLASETRPGDWAAWLDRAGVAHRSKQRRRIFDRFFVTLQAVLDGFGLGIGPLPVLRLNNAAGRLLAPFANITVPRIGYVALIAFDANKTSALAGFVDWLIAQGQERSSSSS
jgi:LysR family transcriptional regulator, glycine cleavage system transcriptional activator